MTQDVRVVRADGHGARQAAEWLCAGGVAVVPTDTVYGLAARPDQAEAVHAIYRMKGRPEGMHLPVLAASVDQVRALGVAFTAPAAALARCWWPGPLTLAFGFESDEGRPAWLEGRAEVAVRIPDHDFVRALLQLTGVLVVTSANRHGAPTPRSARDVVAGLAPSVSFVVDGGELREVPSTLVNVSGPEPTVEREGAIARAAIVGALEESR
ncbi:MAG: L-threonylcarbamoyladenylate synthase [Acidimicrobiales bacterium]